MNTAAVEPRHHRRTREEVEALAKNFVATEGADAAAPPRSRIALFGGGGLALVALLAGVASLDRAQQESRPAADKPRASAEAEQWHARYEAERERKRKELQAGSDYMAKMAAAESALLKEMSARASRLTAVPEATGEPTPREAAPAPRTTQVAKAPTTAPAQPAAQQPAATAPAPAPAKAQPEPATQATTVAAAPQCALHVSQLSASGKLTYEDVKGMKGARMLGDKVLTPPITLDDGRQVTFQVSPDGCMKWRRS